MSSPRVDRQLLAYLIVAVIVAAFAVPALNARHNSRVRKNSRQKERERQQRANRGDPHLVKRLESLPRRGRFNQDWSGFAYPPYRLTWSAHSDEGILSSR